MIFPFASLLAIASVANAIPFKRFDNGTADVTSSGSSDSTVTVDKYVTITLASSTITLAESATSAISAAEAAASDVDVTSTEYVTLTVSGQTVVTPVSTHYPEETGNKESSVASTTEGTVTSTITSVITVTNDDGVATEVPASLADEYSACEASTVTVTVTATPSPSEAASVSTIVQTLTSSVPVTAEFTNSDTTTTMTQWVSVTVEQTSLSTLSPSSIAPSFTSYSNGTDPSNNQRRGLFYAL